MKDLTEGPIPGHIVQLAAPMAVGMLFQTLYYLVDLYFVAQTRRRGDRRRRRGGQRAVHRDGLTQMLGVGTVALIAHAVGRKDQADANLIFNQCLVLAAICGIVATLVGGYAFIGRATCAALGADAATVAAGADLPALVPARAWRLQFALVAMGSALRGTGIVKPTMIVQVLTVLLNAVLAPILIAGWLTGHPLGVAGAGLASSISIAIGCRDDVVVLHPAGEVRRLRPRLIRPRLARWKRMLASAFRPVASSR